MYDIKDPSQRRFAVMGTNIFHIAEKLVHNQTICRLLKYQTKDALDTNKYPNVDGVELINKQILIVPKIYDDENTKMSYVVALFNNFSVNPFNSDFKYSTIRFDIACPYDEWILDNESLRPYLIMQEIDREFNGAKIGGIGNLAFISADALTLSPWIGGYTMRYQVNEFN